jgi:uncharacterized repeat protein (TIGR03803 family)
MKRWDFRRYVLGSCATVVLMTGCSGSQPAFGLPGSPPANKLMQPLAAERVLYSFAGGNDGAYPEAPPILVNGTLYGTTALGGNGGCAFVNGCGTVYALNASGHERVIHAFKTGRDGEAPGGPLLLDPSGSLIGPTVLGGGSGCEDGHVKGCGTIFRISTGGKERVLYRFSGGMHGSQPDALTRARGAFYGEASGGGIGKCDSLESKGCGLLFELKASGALTILYSFEGGKGGGTPQGGLLWLDGNFYGTTNGGGGTACPFNNGCGTAFKMTPSGSVNVLYEFGRSYNDAALPETGLVELDGKFYGTTFSGGRSNCALTGSGYGCGTVFEMTMAGHEKVIYNFTSDDEGGSFPNGLVVVGNTLYGTAQGGGAYRCGTIFTISPAGDLTVLYAFKGGTDGCGPISELTEAKGVLYGTTAGGGAHGDGTVYAIAP